MTKRVKCVDQSFHECKSSIMFAANLFCAIEQFISIKTNPGTFL